MYCELSADLYAVSECEVATCSKPDKKAGGGCVREAVLISRRLKSRQAPVGRGGTAQCSPLTLLLEALKGLSQTD